MSCEEKFDPNANPAHGLHILCIIWAIVIGIFVFAPVQYVSRNTGIPMSRSEIYIDGAITFIFLIVCWRCCYISIIEMHERFKTLNGQIDDLSEKDGSLSARNAITILKQLNNI